MMQNMLNDKEILDFLMSSDFQEGFNQEETRFLLLKFRYQYRLLYAKLESMNYQLSEKDRKIEELSDQNKTTNIILEFKKEQLEIEKNRKLTWKERLYGKKLNK